MSTVSFAKVPGAGSSAPVEAEVVKPGDPGDPASTDTRVAAPTPTNVSHFYGGDEDDDGGPVDRGDVRLPRINVVQGLSGSELKKVGPDGTIALKKLIAIPQPARIVVAGCSRKRYAEKQAVYGKGDIRTFDTLEEVINAGGTDQWKQSRENKDKDGNPVSKKPWFTPMVTALLLVQKPEGLTPDLEEHFAAVSEDGIAFAPAVYTVKSTSFGGFFVPLKTEQTSGVLKNGFYTRYIGLKTNPAVRGFPPVVTILEPTSEAVRKLAKSLLN